MAYGVWGDSRGWLAELVCEGRLRGTGLRWGSAGPVLRSQGTLGQEELSRGRATGIRMSTFLRSLRTAPAAASWSGPGSVPPIYKKGDTLDYTDVVAGAPRDMFRCGLVVSKGLG